MGLLASQQYVVNDHGVYIAENFHATPWIWVAIGLAAMVALGVACWTWRMPWGALIGVSLAVLWRWSWERRVRHSFASGREPLIGVIDDALVLLRPQYITQRLYRIPLADVQQLQVHGPRIDPRLVVVRRDGKTDAMTPGWSLGGPPMREAVLAYLNTHLARRITIEYRHMDTPFRLTP